MFFLKLKNNSSCSETFANWLVSHPAFVVSHQRSPPAVSFKFLASGETIWNLQSGALQCTGFSRTRSDPLPLPSTASWCREITGERSWSTPARKRNTVVMLYRIHNWNHTKRENVTQKMKEYLLDNSFLIEKCITHTTCHWCVHPNRQFWGLAGNPNAGNGKAPATFDDHHSSTALLQLG